MITKSNQNLGKKEIVNNIKSAFGFSTKNIQKITDDIINSLIEILLIDKKLNVKNFGCFRISHKNEREGRNPKTNEEFIVKSRYVVTFKASNFLKQKLND